MNKIYTIEQNGLYLMDTSNGDVDWTKEWEHAITYTNEKRAKFDRDFLGLSMAKILPYECSPPPVPKEAIPVVEKKIWSVYFAVEREVSPGAKQHFKIGYSHDPVKRLKQLQTGHPLKLGLEGWLNFETEEQAQTVEDGYHRMFKYFRTNGEWFTYNKDMEAFIESLRECDNFVRYYC